MAILSNDLKQNGYNINGADEAIRRRDFI